MSDSQRRCSAADALQRVMADDGDYVETDNDSDTASDITIVQQHSDDVDNLGELINAADISDIDEEDVEMESEHDTQSEISENSANDSESDSENVDESAWYGKDKTVWSKKPLTTGRTPSHNIVTSAPGLKGPARANPPKSPIDAWNLMVTDEMLDKILVHTNSKIQSTRSQYKQFTRRVFQRNSTAKKSRPSYVSETERVELNAFLGLLYLQGVFKSGHEDLRSLWATDGTGRDIFRCTMSLARFSFLLSCLRFDDQTTRQERMRTNKLAPILEIFDAFVENSSSNYSPSPYLTVDEMLIPFRGRCGFRMYIPSKPAKYGLKVQILADARNHYMVQGEVYTGALASGVRNANALPIPTQTVLRLVGPVVHTNRNITGDNWYTSVQLVEELKKVGLTYVGTVKKNKRQIPPEFLASRQREVNSTTFGFQQDKMIVSYVPKKNKAVILMSSMHHQPVVSEVKPEIILFYNGTKAGVDALDEKCSLYSTSRRTRRWPMALFHAILNIAGTNSRVIYQSSNPQEQLSRPEYIKKLGIALARTHIERRVGNEKIPRKLRSMAADIFGVRLPPNPNPAADVPKSKRKRCSICPSSRDRKTSSSCAMCKCPICNECAKLICPNCSDM
jgi:Transposase IS4